MLHLVAALLRNIEQLRLENLVLVYLGWKQLFNCNNMCLLTGAASTGVEERGEHELRGHWEGHRGAGREGAQGHARSGGHGRRHFHSQQRRRVRLPHGHPHHQPPAVLHSRHARHIRASRRHQGTGTRVFKLSLNYVIWLCLQGHRFIRSLLLSW